MPCMCSAAREPPSARLHAHPRSLYFTVHTASLPNGALRGQIALRQAPVLVDVPGDDAPAPLLGPALAPAFSPPTPAPVLAPEPSAEAPTSEPPTLAPEPSADAPTSQPAPGPSLTLLAPGPAPALASSPSITPTALPVVRLSQCTPLWQQQEQLLPSPCCQPLAPHPHVLAVAACPGSQEWRATLLPSRNGDAGAKGTYRVMLQPDGETFGQAGQAGWGGGGVRWPAYLPCALPAHAVLGRRCALAADHHASPLRSLQVAAEHAGRG